MSHELRGDQLSDANENAYWEESLEACSSQLQSWNLTRSLRVGRGNRLVITMNDVDNRPAHDARLCFRVHAYG
jgi:hypothetical protein